VRRTCLAISTIAFAALGLGCCTLVECQTVAHYRHDGKAALNDLSATPGLADAALTKAKLCSPDFRTGTVRNVTQTTKVKVCAEYGVKNCPSHAFEIDHLISLELGGSDDITNLWPQPVDATGVIGFHTKDVVENRAHRAVCNGTLTLKQAQDGISTDWYAFAKKYGLLVKAVK
jgi:hypothetical protein